MFLMAAAKIVAKWQVVELSSITRARGAAGPSASGRVRPVKVKHSYEWIQHLASFHSPLLTICSSKW